MRRNDIISENHIIYKVLCAVTASIDQVMHSTGRGVLIFCLHKAGTSKYCVVCKSVCNVLIIIYGRGCLSLVGNIEHGPQASGKPLNVAYLF